ncbi:MAG TPA: BrxA family protein [Anaerolineae bacterium]|nr:BrxA family protein [Anaerolineae bacterium]
MTSVRYTTQLQAGKGLVEETHLLLELWQPGMSAIELTQAALRSGRFPTISARRLRNIVVEAFTPRYLVDDTRPARRLQALQSSLSRREFGQTLFLYTSRANAILADFVRDVYWPAYAAGKSQLSNEEARAWVLRANQDGKTMHPWSDETIERVAGYLTRSCADFGLLQGGVLKARRILPYWIEPRTAAFLAYDLHCGGLGDNAVLAHPDWALFGLERMDVLEELKKLALKGLLLVQAAGGVIKISWQLASMEALIDVLARDELR